MEIPLLSDRMKLRSVAFQIYFTNIWGYSEATHFMRTCWFIAYNFRLESPLPDMQELLCFSQSCRNCRSCRPDQIRGGPNPRRTKSAEDQIRWYTCRQTRAETSLFYHIGILLDSLSNDAI